MLKTTMVVISVLQLASKKQIKLA